MSPYFRAEFPLSTPVKDIEALNAAYALEVHRVTQDEEAIVYSLRTTAATGISTIDMANIYHEHPLTTRAYPLFWAVDIVS